ncbi:SagB/ThcOx family dehydrogenase [Pelagibius litoralis]|uniref:SagB/ThcOx family dehydrogenase n=1 Tax=Pelagibius litoralis TaxID=374515 RepID=A0A967KGM7_9PROT|nr:SagB/ThcOx family dehydrogenase [Pelagibius litoralis]NIA72315.1 SagB/ThcOx family dehydrogenase [Pelagibius litoralis]
MLTRLSEFNPAVVHIEGLLKALRRIYIGHTFMLTIHPGVRLRPQGFLHDCFWAAEHLVTRKRYLLTAKSAATLFAVSGKPESIETACPDIAELIQTPVNQVRKYLDFLIDSKIIVDGEKEERSWAEKLYGTWAKYHWSASAHYHVATYDYPFADYAEGGRRIDRQRMTSYGSEECDMERGKSYPQASERVVIGRPTAARVTATLGQVWDSQVTPAALKKDALCDLLAMTFGQVGRRNLPTRGSLPVLAKTSPSGGARHPTEAYVAVADVPGLKSGWYHFNALNAVLERIIDEVDSDMLGELFYGSWSRAPFEPRAIVLMTSVFGRNMYRYREPRTYRTIHMDAGHLISSLEHFAAAKGLSTHAQSGTDDFQLEQLLGLSPLQEGVMFAVSLGDGLRKEG